MPIRNPSTQRLPSFLASRRTILLASGVIIFATLAAYHNSLSVPFLFDDRGSITENPTIRQLWPIGRVLSPPVGGLTVSGRPVVNFSLAANYAVGGTAVWGYHAVNVAIHLLASLTLLEIVRRMLLKPGLREQYGPMALPLALAVAGLWGLHPLQTESVTYVVQRAESLMGLFYLLTLYGFIRGTETQAKRWYALAMVACVLGMGTKEVMVSAPLIVLLYDRTFVTGTFVGALRARWRVYVGLGSSWLVLAYLVVQAGELGSERAGFETGVSWWRYGLTQIWAVGHYLWLVVWPQGLVLDYGTMLVTRATEVAPGAVMIVALLVGTLVSLRRWPVLGFLGCFFFAILAPTSSVMPLTGQTVAEHRMYLALAAVVVVLVLSVYGWLGRRSFVLFMIAAAVLGLLTARRNQDYQSEVAIWSDTVAKQPDNTRALGALGFALLRADRVPEAISYLKQTLRLAPADTMAHNNLGIALYRIGKVAEAIPHYEEVLRLKPDFGEAHYNLGTALLELGKVEEGIVHLEQGLRFKSDDADAHYNLGKALLRLGRVPEAIGHLEQTLRLKPEDAEAHKDLGVALIRLGRVPDGVMHLEQAVRIKPEDAEVQNNLAWVRATETNSAIRNVDEAVRLAARACELTAYKVAGYLDTLGVAYSEAGRFQEAVAATERAVACAVAGDQKDLAARIEARLKYYRVGRSYHDIPP